MQPANLAWCAARVCPWHGITGGSRSTPRSKSGGYLTCSISAPGLAAFGCSCSIEEAVLRGVVLTLSRRLSGWAVALPIRPQRFARVVGNGSCTYTRLDRASAMNRHSFACFRCRTAVRRARIPLPSRASHVRCPNCGELCTWLGAKIPVPPRSSPKKWTELQDWLLSQRDREIALGHVGVVQRIHALERRISEIERRPANKGRASVVKFLRGHLRNKLHRYR